LRRREEILENVHSAAERFLHLHDHVTPDPSSLKIALTDTDLWKT